MSRFTQRLLEQWPADEWAAHRIVIACSGGPDSTALARLIHICHPTPSRLTLAHFHHNLRQEAADDDARFVQQLAEQLGIACEIGLAEDGEVRQQAVGEGMESAARHLRYEFLVNTAHRLGARYLVTGHTADDQAETVLYQVLRGSGLAGLAGIPKYRIASEALTIARPLLGFSRDDVTQCLAELDQTACDDEHNRQLCFQRNRIRLELIPWLQENINPAVRESLLNLARISEDAQDLIRQQAESLADQATVLKTERHVVLSLAELQDIHIHLKRELFVVIWQRQGWPLQAMTFAHWQRLANCVLQHATPAFDLPAGIRVNGNQAELTISDLGSRR